MKHYAFITILCSLSFLANAQKLMMLPDGLKAASDQYGVVVKGGVGMMKYQFGPYRTARASNSWTTFQRKYETGFRSRFFFRGVEEHFNEKGSFVMVLSAKDTAIVNFGISTQLQYRNFASRGASDADQSEYRGGSATYLAIIVQNSDTTNWILATTIIETANGGWFLQSDFQGKLTTNGREINLIPVKLYHDGKKENTGGDLLGVIFQEGETYLGAVQFKGLPLKQHKQNFVWLAQGTDERLRNILAVAATAIMVRAHIVNDETLVESIK
jgi:hypothetical protein